MEKPCIRSQFHFISEQPVRYAVTLPIIWLPFPANQTSRSWKARRLSATSSRAACRVARLFLIGLSETRRRPVSHQICIPNSRPWALQAGEDSRVVTARREKQCERQVTNAMVSEFRYRRRNSDHKPVQAQFRRGKWWPTSQITELLPRATALPRSRARCANRY